jgi:hypothetical protein
MPSPTTLAPSEIVLLHGDRFAEAKRPIALFTGRTTLLDGRSCVSSKQLVANMLKAALLAHEQAGDIRFEIGDAGNQHPDAAASLMVVPTGKSADWPRATLEARLVLNERRSVADVVSDWLAEDSRNPWDRAAEQGKIMLVLRGIATVSSSWRGRRYLFADAARAPLSQVSPQPVEELLARCRENRPDVWRLLEAEIEEVTRARTRKNDSRVRGFVDPWDSEAATDRDRFLGPPHVIRANNKSGVLLALVGVALAVLTGWLAYKNDLLAFTALVAGFLTLAGGLLILRPTQLRGVERRISTWASSRSSSLSEQPPASIWDSLIGLVFLVPLVTLSLLIVGLAVARPFLWLGALAAILYAAYRLIQTLAGERIDEVVKSDSGQHSSSPNPQPVAAPAASALSTVPQPERQADGFARGAVGGAAQVFLETITPDAIPPASASSQARIDLIRMRAPAIRSVYRKGVAFLAIATTALPVAYWLAGPAPIFFSDGGVHFSERTPWFTVVALLATLALVSPRAIPWVRGLRNAALVAAIAPRAEFKVAPQEVDEGTLSIRPFALRLLATFWIAVALLRAAISYPSLAPPLPLIFIAITLVSVAGYLYWIHRRAAAVERQYCYQPPLNLLALRVFGSPNLADFLNLSDAWQWIGTRQLLDGPDTAGHKAKDLLNYLVGRIDRSIIDDATELREALEAFSTRPDRMLRFPVNSMQCANATWKEALQHLLDRADVVVMDLSSLSQQNRGVAYEIGKLADEVSLNRVVLLFDESTDLDVLKDILARAYEGIAADSPNRQSGGLRVRVFDMGGTTARKPDEAAYDWKRRMRTRMNEHALVGLLFDAAHPPRSATTIDPRRDRAAIRWSRLAMPGWLRWVVNVVWWAFLLSVAMVSLYRLAHSA